MVLGISVDKIEDQKKFTEKEGLNYPLLADPEKQVVKRYGVLSPRGFAQRSTFVIDREGVVRKVYPAVTNAREHPEEVMKFVKEHLAEKK